MGLATKPDDKPNHDYKGERGDFGKLGGRQTPIVAAPSSRHHSSSHRTMSHRRMSSPILNSAMAATSADFSSGAQTMPRTWVRDRMSDARQALSFAAVGFFFGARIAQR